MQRELFLERVAKYEMNITLVAYFLTMGLSIKI